MPLIQGEKTMKNRTIKLFILLSIATMSLTACGKKSEPVNEAPETTAIVETTTTEESEPVEEIPVEEETIIEEEITDTEISSITLAEELNIQLYVVKESNILDADNNDAKIISPVEFGVPLEVTGKTSNGWYEVQTGYLKGYLPADVLSTENPLPQEDLSQVYGDDGRTAEEILEAFEKANSSGALDDIIGPGADGMEYTGTAKEQFENSDWW